MEHRGPEVFGRDHCNFIVLAFAREFLDLTGTSWT